MRIGQMLVSAGLLNTDQVEAILRKQQSHPEPFGLLAQRLYGIDRSLIEIAYWIVIGEFASFVIANLLVKHSMKHLRIVDIWIIPIDPGRSIPGLNSRTAGSR